ncbi:MAG: glycosyltransferase [Pyrinomonadaceae bacterium MAG19_C2-C3]|nr:glycosyltransferase [Pyrinomonadaceae bacterium MAG19_C2-C3]
MKSKSTVLHLLPSFHQGGSERQALQLARLLCDDGHYNVRVAVIDPEGVLRAEAEKLDIDEIGEFPLTSFYDANMLRQTARFVSHLRANDIDILQTHDFYSNVFGLTSAKLAGVRGRIGARRESATRPAKQRAVERATYRCAHAVVANCEEVRRQLIEVEGLAPAKALTIYNGLDMQRVKSQNAISRSEKLASFNLPIDVNTQFVTIVANLRLPLKDHPTFLRAAQRVREHVPEAHFILAGEGELSGELRALADELGLHDSAHFIGRCERVGELLAVSDACVLSSISEGFSNSILEYMAAARPVVVTDVGGAREAVAEGENGFIVNPRDDETMAEHIVFLLQNPEQARTMGARGRHIVETKFSTHAQIGRTVEIYEKLLSHAARNRNPNASESVSA